MYRASDPPPVANERIERVGACCRYADRMLRPLGEIGPSVVVRLCAFIVLCIGVQIVWTGASALLATLPVTMSH